MILDKKEVDISMVDLFVLWTMTPMGIPVDTSSWLIKSDIQLHNNPLLKQDFTQITYDEIIHTRLVGCKVLGKMVSTIKTDEEWWKRFLTSYWAIQRIFCGVICFEWLSYKVC